MLIIGDSKLENELKVAEGFPNATLGPDDIIISQVFAQYFGLKNEERSLLNLTINLNSIFKEFGIESKLFFEYDNGITRSG